MRARTTVDVSAGTARGAAVQLIRADGRRERVLLEIADIVVARGEAGHTGAGNEILDVEAKMKI